MARTSAGSGSVVFLLMVAAGCRHQAGSTETMIADAAATMADAAATSADAAIAGDTTSPPGAECDGPCQVSFASGSDWSVYDDDPATNPSAHRLGGAQPVCLNATAPPSCPAGAVIYGYPGGFWSVSLLPVPGALWVWGPGVSPTAPADLQRFFFSRVFVVGTQPRGHISVAADDAAEIRINGKVLDSVGSVIVPSEASMANSQLTTFDLSSLLVAGSNTITIAAQNGPQMFGGCPSACAYSSNPAGVVFGGEITWGGGGTPADSGAQGPSRDGSAHGSDGASLSPDCQRLYNCCVGPAAQTAQFCTGLVAQGICGVWLQSYAMAGIQCP
jgi:hypothetical protein